MQENPQVRSLGKRIAVSASIGLIVAIGGSAVEAVFYHHSFATFEAADDVVIGMFAALVVFWYEQRQYRSTLNKIRVIAAMNHHIRNALQAIMYAPYANQEKQIALIADSVNRIQWALREILPGENVEDILVSSDAITGKPRASTIAEEVRERTEGRP